MNYSHSTPTPIDTVDKVDRPKTQTESLSRLSTLSYGVDARGSAPVIGSLWSNPGKGHLQPSYFLVCAFWKW